MTKEEIIRMALEAGWSGIYTQWAEPTGEPDWSPFKVSLTVPVTMEQIERFAALVAKHEREACAKVAESMRPHGGRMFDDAQSASFSALTDCAAAIRARGQA
jgi:hypothetical protein